MAIFLKEYNTFYPYTHRFIYTVTDSMSEPSSPLLGYWKFIDIPSDTTDIWRYRSFPQFLSVLEYGGLWFSRIDKFKDQYEASVTDSDVERILQKYEYDLNERENWDVEYLQNAGKGMRKTVYANCWHERSIESAAMWDIYSRKGQAVAIKSTVGNVLEAIAESNGIEIGDEPVGSVGTISIGRVKYLDFDEEFTPPNSLVRPFFKRESFEHENEIRITAQYTHADLTPEEDNIREFDPSSQPAGFRLDLSVDELINEVRISPWADDWFVDLVKEVADTYGVDRVYESELTGEPNILL